MNEPWRSRCLTNSRETAGCLAFATVMGQLIRVDAGATERISLVNALGAGQTPDLHA